MCKTRVLNQLMIAIELWFKHVRRLMDKNIRFSYFKIHKTKLKPNQEYYIETERVLNFVNNDK